MIKSIVVTASVGAALATIAYAGVMEPLQEGSDVWVPVVSLSAGPAWASSHNTETIFLTPLIENTLVATKKSTELANIELFLGWQDTLSSPTSLARGRRFGRSQPCYIRR